MKQHLDHIRTFPDFQKAKNEGVLRDIVFNPTDSELEDVLANSLACIFSHEEEMDALVDLNKKLSRRTSDKCYLTPSSPFLFGRRISPYLVIKEDAASFMTKEEDMKSLVSHRVDQARDFYRGIVINDVAIHIANPTDCSSPFITDLLKFRADYRQLERAFRNITIANEMGISRDWFAELATSYVTTWNGMKEKDLNPFEKSIRDIQLEEFKGITPGERDGKPMLGFNLFGHMGYTTFG